eukprot:1391787-Pyramimonas_sp.AAC.1
MPKSISLPAQVGTCANSNLPLACSAQASRSVGGTSQSPISSQGPWRLRTMNAAMPIEMVEVLAAEADARGEVDRADAQGKGTTN